MSYTTVHGMPARGELNRGQWYNLDAGVPHSSDYMADARVPRNEREGWFIQVGKDEVTDGPNLCGCRRSRG
jgi:hypothetical protein